MNTAEQFDDTALIDVEANSGSSQYLTFMLAGEEYGVEILKVQEIKGWDTVTPIPNTPDYMLGVLNLRGAIVPIVDLRNRFKLDDIQFGPTTVVIVVKMQNEDQTRTVGLVVDAVAEVYRLENDAVQPPPEMGSSVQTEFVRGLVTVDKKMVILLEVDRLIDFEALDAENASPAEKAAE